MILKGFDYFVINCRIMVSDAHNLYVLYIPFIVLHVAHYKMNKISRPKAFRYIGFLYVTCRNLFPYHVYMSNWNPICVVLEFDVTIDNTTIYM